MKRVKRVKIEMGMKVKTKIDKMTYYGEAWIEAGSIGEVAAVDVPFVRRRGTFNCVDFTRERKRVRAAYTNRELEIAQV